MLFFIELFKRQAQYFPAMFVVYLDDTMGVVSSLISCKNTYRISHLIDISINQVQIEIVTVDSSIEMLTFVDEERKSL